jgi:hypothetical protein
MSTITTRELIDEQVANQKFVLVQAAAPAATYDGQVWVCTSSDPPLLEIRDETNSKWMQRHSVAYSAGTDAYKPLSSPPTLGGDLSIQYATGGDQTSGQTFLYFKANGLWWGKKNS